MVLLFFFTDRIESLGNEIKAAEAGVDVPGAAFIIHNTVLLEVKYNT